MSTRAIGRVLGITERTTRRDLSGAADAAPGNATVVGRDGKIYPRKPPPQPADRELNACSLCNRLHPEPVDDCPDLDVDLADLFGPIVLSADDEPESPPSDRNPGRSPGEQATARPAPNSGSRTESAGRRLRNLVAKVQVTYEHLIRLPDLVDSLSESLGEPGWTEDLAGELRTAAHGLRGQLARIETVLNRLDGVVERVHEAAGP